MPTYVPLLPQALCLCSKPPSPQERHSLGVEGLVSLLTFADLPRSHVSRGCHAGDEYPSTTPKDNHPGSNQSGICKNLNAFYQFSRPHTVIGTLIGITSVSLLPLESTADISVQFFVGLLKALVPSILMNIYVVGLNQLFDVDIDKVNKPYLPLASGEFSMELGWAIVSTFLLMSFTLGIMFQSPPLLCALIVSFLLGSAYSIEIQSAPLSQMEKKRISRCNMHLDCEGNRRSTGLLHSHPVAFMCLFSTIIALFKDIPDVDGDRDYGIQSFSVRLGQEKVFWLCISLLLIGYGSAMAIGASSSFLASKLVTVLGHCALASSLWLRARSVDLNSKESITSLYMFIWKATLRLCSDLGLVPRGIVKVRLRLKLTPTSYGVHRKQGLNGNPASILSNSSILDTL
ncbi:hypothetical protein C3L33_17749, partial [Rhododendron williamsianum]